MHINITRITKRVIGRTHLNFEKKHLSEYIVKIPTLNQIQRLRGG